MLNFKGVNSKRNTGGFYETINFDYLFCGHGLESVFTAANMQLMSTDSYLAVVSGWSVALQLFAYGTSYFSAVVFVGYAGKFGWKYGISATWAGIGNAIIGSLLAWVVLGRRTRIMSQHLNSATMPQFFGERFKAVR